MKFGVLNKIPKEQLAKAGGDLPGWIDALLDPLNEFISKVGIALQGNIDFENNFSSIIKTFTLVSGTELVVNPNPAGKTRRVRGVIILSAQSLPVDKLAWSDKGNGTIGITITLGSGTQANCDVLILYRGD